MRLNRGIPPPTAALMFFVIICLATGISAWWMSIIQNQNTNGLLKGLDEPLLNWAHEHTSSLFKFVLIIISDTVTFPVLTPMLGIPAWLLYRKGYWPEAGGLVLGVVASALFALACKSIYDTPRPQVPWALPSNWSSSYPSGHVAIALNLAGMSIFLLLRHGASRKAVLAATVVGLSFVLLMGYSRVALGVHYPSDVLAGYALGLVWLVASFICVTLPESVVGYNQSKIRSQVEGAN